MFVFPGMSFALFSADSACHAAGFEHAPNQLLIGASAPRRYGARRVTDVGAILIQPYALSELLDALLAEAGVGASNARLSAVIAFINASDQGIIRLSLDVGMGADHFACMHRMSS